MKEERNEFMRGFRQLRSFRDEIETRNSILFTNSTKGFVQLQEDHRQPMWFVQLQKDRRQFFTTPHIYIATRPSRSWGSSGDSKSRLGARHRHH